MATYIFLLLIDVTNLEPDVFLIEGTWWVVHDIFETLRGQYQSLQYLGRTHFETLLELLLLLVDYPKPEIDFIRFLEVGLHAHDLRERFLCMLQRAVPIVEYTDAVP